MRLTAARATITRVIPATEHKGHVCSWRGQRVKELFRHLPTDVYPKGFVTW